MPTGELLANGFEVGELVSYTQRFEGGSRRFGFVQSRPVTSEWATPDEGYVWAHWRDDIPTARVAAGRDRPSWVAVNRVQRAHDGGGGTMDISNVRVGGVYDFNNSGCIMRGRVDSVNGAVRVMVTVTEWVTDVCNHAESYPVGSVTNAADWCSDGDYAPTPVTPPAVEVPVWVPAVDRVANGATFRFFRAPNEAFWYEGTMRDWDERAVTVTALGDWPGPFGRTLPYDSDHLDANSPVDKYMVLANSTAATPVVWDEYRGARGKWTEISVNDLTEQRIQELYGSPARGRAPLRGFSFSGQRKVMGPYSYGSGATTRIRATHRLEGGVWMEYARETEKQLDTNRLIELFIPRAQVERLPIVSEDPYAGKRHALIPVNNYDDCIALKAGDTIEGVDPTSARRRVFGTMITDGTGDIIRVMVTHTKGRDSGTWTKVPPGERSLFVSYGMGASPNGTKKVEWLSADAPDPSLDPERKSKHGIKIGQYMVGRKRNNGRDTPTSWMRGILVKHHLPSDELTLKVTDPMASLEKVGAEVEVLDSDGYPNLEDVTSPPMDEYKRAMRAYLIGRHKRGDFCQGGLNSMLMAFGMQEYTTRRKATITLDVTYDPNSTDVAELRRNLASQIGVAASATNVSIDRSEDVEDAPVW